MHISNLISHRLRYQLGNRPLCVDEVETISSVPLKWGVRVVRCVGRLSAFVGLVAGLAVSQAVADTSQPEPSPFLVPVSDLATQDTRPFLQSGREVTPELASWNTFKSIVADYPDARPCLLETAEADGVVDLLAFNWEAPADSPSVRVCLFRVFTTLDDPELVADWLSAHGFSVVSTPSVPRTGPVSTKRIPTAMSVYGAWTPEQFYVRRPSSRPGRFSLKRLILEINVSVQFSSDNKVIGTEFYGRTK